MITINFSRDKNFSFKLDKNKLIFYDKVFCEKMVES